MSTKQFAIHSFFITMTILHIAHIKTSFPNMAATTGMENDTFQKANRSHNQPVYECARREATLKKCIVKGLMIKVAGPLNPYILSHARGVLWGLQQTHPDQSGTNTSQNVSPYGSVQ